jgi:hypothetical protein
VEKWFLKGKFEYFGGNDSECFELISADEPFAFLSGWDLGESFGQAGKELGGRGGEGPRGGGDAVDEHGPSDFEGESTRGGGGGGGGGV